MAELVSEVAERVARLHDIEAARERLSLGRSAFYDLMTSGQIRSVKVGRRRLIPESAIVEFISRLEATGAA